MAVFGVDVYHGDGKINWKALVKKGVQFAYVKVSQGAAFVDPRGIDNIKAAQDAGIIAGPYHYLWPEGGAVDQYDNFRAVIDRLGGMEGLLLPALDVEGDQNNSISPLTATQYTARAIGWLILFENEFGVKPVVYTYPSFAQDYIFGRLSAYPLWASSFTNAGPGFPARFADWDHSWTFHQYTTTGKPNPLGIPIADQNIFNGGVDDLRKLIVTQQTTPIKVVDHKTGRLLETLQMVENGWHPEQGKIYVQGGK